MDFAIGQKGEMMDDTTSRQAAQPDTHDTNVGDTTHKNVIYSPVQMAMDYAVNATDFSASSDTISRQAAITAIQNAYCDTEGGEDKCAVWKNVGLTNALHIMQDLPSAQPERIKGHWIEILDAEAALSNHTYKCSVCGRLLVNIMDGKNNVAKHYPYCHCGADMRGVKEDGETG